MNAGTLRIEVPGEEAGSRLDRFLTGHVEGRTRSALRRLILDGHVTVDGKQAPKPGLNLESGMVVQVELPEPDEGRPRPEKIPLDVIHEDEHIVVVNKPAGLVVHPGHGCREGTLVNALLGRETALAATGAPDRPGIVHRLDRGTSGLIVVAKSDAAHEALAAAFARREVDKHYVALVWGRVDPPSGSVERPVGRSRTNRVKMSVCSPRGRPALTAYATRESIPGFSLLDIRLETGRTHQIRVHMQSIHHPVVGDERYGGRIWKGVQDPGKRKALRSFERLALHAARLAFSHPVTAERLRFEAALPEEIAALLAVLRQAQG